MQLRPVRSGALVVALVACVSAYAAAPALPIYSITAIAPPPHSTAVVPSAINTSGEITGSIVFSPGLPAHAFVYRSGTLTDIGTLNYPGTATPGDAAGLSINDAGEVAGTILQPVYQAWAFGFQYTNGTMTGLFLRTGFPLCTANGINASGLIVGGCSNISVSDTVIYQSGTPMAIGPQGGSASAVNVYGQVAAYSTTSGFIFYNNVVTNIPALATASSMPVARPTAINNAGQVVGWQAEGATYSTFLYSTGTTTALPGVPVSAIQPAPAINNAGQIVGYTAASTSAAATPYFVANGSLSNVNALISLSDPNQKFVTFTRAFAINDNAWIVAAGVDSRTGLTGAYLLMPTTPFPLAVTVLADPILGTGEVGTAFTVAWIDQSADMCNATGGSGNDGWGGPVATNGGQMQLTESVAGTYNYTVTCLSGANSVSSTASVEVKPSSSGGLGGGSGALDLRTLAALVLLLALRVLAARRA